MRSIYQLGCNCSQCLGCRLYYTGLETQATFTPGSAGELLPNAVGAVEVGVVHQLRRDYSVVIEMTVGANSYAWWTVH